jgi:mono/diheme cytochrome c family protein
LHHKMSRLVILPLLLLSLLLLLLSSCQQDMAIKGRSTPLEPSTFFKDGRSARPQPEGTVAQGQLNDDTLLHTGIQNSKPSPTFPFEITRATLVRGQDRYNIFCAPCHDQAGTGKGVVIPLGFERGPESFHSQRMREAAPGHIFNAITNGFGIMNGYAAQIRPEDRWAIVAYVRALQLSQNANVSDLSEQDLQQLEKVGR